jgi:hypothetical protein
MRHFQVQQDQVWLHGLGGYERFPPAGSFANHHKIIFQAQDGPQALADGCPIINDQDFDIWVNHSGLPYENR